MGDKKLSSVEWLVEQLRKNEFIDDPTELIDEAKTMHRKEIEEAYDAIIFDDDGILLGANKYYNATFGGQNNE